MQIRHIAIIGLGSIGKRHLKVLRAMDPSIKISVVKKPESASSEEEVLANNIFYNIEDAIKAGVQAALICTPAPFHIEQARKLAAAGVHLMIEKPLSDQVDELELFQKSTHSSSLIITVAYVLRFRPDLKYFSDFLKNSDIGIITEIQIQSSSYLPEWRPDTDYRKSISAKKDLGGGVLLELSHEFDYMQWLFSAAKTVFAKLQNKGLLGIEAEEEADLKIVCMNNETVNMRLDFVSKVQKRCCTVISEKGKFTCDFINKEVSLDYSNKEKTVKTFDFDYNYPYTEQLKNFINCIENKLTPLVSLEDGIKTVYLIDAARKSNLSGKTESVDYVK